jgi:hypothetical protein
MHFFSFVLLSSLTYTQNHFKINSLLTYYLLSMTILLQRSRESWSDIGGLSTADEIAQQPVMWRERATIVQHERHRVAALLGDRLNNPRQRV